MWGRLRFYFVFVHIRCIYKCYMYNIRKYVYCIVYHCTTFYAIRTIQYKLYVQFDIWCIKENQWWKKHIFFSAMTYFLMRMPYRMCLPLCYIKGEGRVKKGGCYNFTYVKWRKLRYRAQKAYVAIKTRRNCIAYMSWYMYEKRIQK